MSQGKSLDLAHLDSSIRPQDDLFRHVNQHWLESTEIPADQAIYGSFMKLRDDSELAVRQILEEAAKDPKPGVSQKIGDLFATFMDEATIEELGAAPIAAELNLIKSARQLDDITELLGELSRGGVSGLFGLYVDNDPGDPKRYLVHAYQAGLGLPDESYYHDPKYQEIRDAYIPHIAQMFSFAGFEMAQAEAAAERIMHLETELAKHHWDVVATRDAEKVYNLTAFSHLQELTPTFDWSLWLKGAGVSAKVLDELVVMMPSFFEGLASVYHPENLENLKLWLSWQVINSSAPYLSSNFVNERFAFYGTKLTGQPQLRARWKRAVQAVEGSLGEAIGEIYVERHFPAKAKHRMDELVEYLVRAYRESISSLDWMTEETKAKALVKLEKFTPKIGYPVKWRDYSKLEIKRGDLVGNLRRVAAFDLEREAAKIGSPIDRDEWFMTPQTVNAYYNPGFNEIVFPAAILQPPFFSFDEDDAANFGGIGAVIGHEIGHGFDDQGSKYDGDGTLQSWWTEADRKAFEARTGSLIDQYSALSPKQLGDEYKVNGALTIGENIGDLGGLSIAYKAYVLACKDRGVDPDAVVNGLTGTQRFLVAWATIWQSKSRDELAIQRLATDPHSPNEFRCNQTIRNADIFYEAFGVGPDDALWLEPAERVRIW